MKKRGRLISPSPAGIAIRAEGPLEYRLFPKSCRTVSARRCVFRFFA